MESKKKSLLSFRLSAQFLVVMMLVSVLFSLLTSFLVKSIETRQMMELSQVRAEPLLESAAVSLQPAILSRNSYGLTLLAAQLIREERDIYRVIINAEDGEALVDEKRPGIKPQIKDVDDPLVFVRQMVSDGVPIGSLTLYWDFQRYQDIVNKNARQFLLYSLAFYSLAIVLFLVVASMLIFKPIQQIEEHLTAVSGRKRTEDITLPTYCAPEFHDLSNAVNDLHTSIIEQDQREKSLVEATAEKIKVRRQLIQAIEAVTEGFVYYDSDDKLAFCNQKYRDIYPESADLLEPGNTFEYIIRTGAERGQYEAAVGRVDDWVAERMEQHRHPLGPMEQKLTNDRWVRIIETRSEDGGLVGIRSDISEFKKTQNDLKQAKEAAEEANETKSQFLAMMSHEIRTPLNGVLGILGFLNSSDLDDEQQRMVQIGQESASNLLTVINDILDFSKLEVGKVELEMAAFSPASAFNSIIDLLEPGAFAKGISLQLEKLLPDDLYLYGDASRMRQILLNLVGNAIKFTTIGGVKVLIAVSEGQDGKALLKFDVIDTGIGVPLEKQKLLFGEFVTVDSSYTRKFGGTGLGLSISKGFVELLGGDIGFESKEGSGSRFWFSVLLDRAKEEDVPTNFEGDDMKEITARPNSRVLVAEDNAANQMVARKILENIGCQVDVVGNGIEAVDAASHLPYDLILMDISMPEMDGLAATRKIRDMGGAVAKTPIVAMTAHALKEEKEEFLAAGMDDYLRKPSPPRKIHLIVDKWINGMQNEPEKVGKKTEVTSFIDESALQELSKETGIEILPELVQCFIDDTGSRKIEILQSIKDQDAQLLESQTHSLGSSAATFGAMSLHHLCRKVEKFLREKEEVTAYEFAEHLEVTIDNSLTELNKFVSDLNKNLVG